MKALLVFLFLSTGFIGCSQDLISVEANLLRFAEKNTLYETGSLKNDPFFVNGLNVGYSVSTQFRPYFAFLLTNANTNRGFGFTSEQIEKKGIEFRGGLDFILNPKNKMQAIIGAQAFYNRSSVEGLYFVDYGPPFSHAIDHETKDIGWAITPGVKYQAFDNVYLYAKARIGQGNYKIKTKPEVSNSEWFNPYENLSSYAEPVGAMGVAVLF